MQIATTLQFRKAVRKYLSKKALTCYGSYTNGSSRKDSDPARTVGFWVPQATPEMACKIEKKLNKKGLTAQTRHTNSGARMPSGMFTYGGHSYIRGTCVLPD